MKKKALRIFIVSIGVLVLFLTPALSAGDDKTTGTPNDPPAGQNNTADVTDDPLAEQKKPCLRWGS